MLYVGLSSAFHFVGLAYGNVSQVCLLVLFVGLLDSLLGGAGRRFGPLANAP